MGTWTECHGNEIIAVTWRKRPSKTTFVIHFSVEILHLAPGGSKCLYLAPHFCGSMWLIVANCGSQIRATFRHLAPHGANWRQVVQCVS